MAQARPTIHCILTSNRWSYGTTTQMHLLKEAINWLKLTLNLYFLNNHYTIELLQGGWFAQYLEAWYVLASGRLHA